MYVSCFSFDRFEKKRQNKNKHPQGNFSAGVLAVPRQKHHKVLLSTHIHRCTTSERKRVSVLFHKSSRAGQWNSAVQSKVNFYMIWKLECSTYLCSLFQQQLHTISISNHARTVQGLQRAVHPVNISPLQNVGRRSVNTTALGKELI